MPGEIGRADEECRMGIERACDACEERREEEGHHFVVDYIDAGQGCGIFVGLDSCHGTAIAGMFEAVPEGDDEHDEDQKDDAHEELSCRLRVDFQCIDEADVTRIVRKDACHGRDTGVAKRAVGDVQIQRDDADDFAEAQRRDGEVQPAQADGRQADDECDDRRGAAAQEDA